MPIQDKKKSAKNRKIWKKANIVGTTIFFFFFTLRKKVEKRSYGEFKTDEFRGLDILEVFLIVD